MKIIIEIHVVLIYYKKVNEKLRIYIMPSPFRPTSPTSHQPVVVVGTSARPTDVIPTRTRASSIGSQNVGDNIQAQLDAVNSQLLLLDSKSTAEISQRQLDLEGMRLQLMQEIVNGRKAIQTVRKEKEGVQDELTNAQRKLGTISEAWHIQNAQLGQTTQELNAARNALEELGVARIAFSNAANAHQSAEARVQYLQNQLNALRSSTGSKKEKQTAEAKLNKARQESEQTKKKLDDAENKKIGLEASVQKLQEELKKQQEEAGKKFAELTERGRDDVRTAITRTKEEADAQVQDLSRQLVDAQGTISTLSRELHQAHGMYTELLEQISQQQAPQTTGITSLEADELRRKLQQQQEENEKLQAQNKKLQGQLEVEKKRRMDATQANQPLKDEIKKLEAQLAKLGAKSTESQQGTIKELKKELEVKKQELDKIRKLYLDSIKSNTESSKKAEQSSKTLLGVVLQRKLTGVLLHFSAIGMMTPQKTKQEQDKNNALFGKDNAPIEDYLARYIDIFQTINVRKEDIEKLRTPVITMLNAALTRVVAFPSKSHNEELFTTSDFNLDSKMFSSKIMAVLKRSDADSKWSDAINRLFPMEQPLSKISIQK